MTQHFNSPKSRRLLFVVFVLISLAFSVTVSSDTAYGKKKRSAGKTARTQKGKRATARNRSTSRRGRNVARNSRRSRGPRLSARELRRQVAREQSAAIRARERRLGRRLTARERSAEMRRASGRSRRAILEARRRAEAARRAAIARQMAIDKAMRDEVQTFIPKDDLTGEDAEVRRVAVNALGNHAGTVVVMDPMTGRVYSIVNQEWALRRGFKPCSTIKLVTGVAGLSENAVPLFETAGDGFRT